MRTPWRRLLSRIELEGIPWPGACFYNALSRSSPFQKHYALVADEVAVLRPASVLDIGTGPGWLLLRLRERLPGASLHGADISRAMVDKAEKNLPGSGIVLKCAGSEALPYPDASFDVVVSTGSLHHWKNPVAGLNEIRRVLTPGGRALVYDLVRKMPEDVARRVRAEYGRFRATLMWLHSFEEPFYSAAEMETLAAQSDFAGGETGFTGALCRLRLDR
ncbi:MAG TPA: class I SAM-dependent methyltransferase [Kiritimatiellia bacterium]|nr:class I SAM-dependent methyltransferase [Kiritimatiellia bacterium]HRZ13630.1 class I SAM-dependent methyltransferase [Kiritimatiellia bacterium]HSA19274.1 class I SAM-dependent methyltransferase [Kiritimatiellia bacterium]